MKPATQISQMLKVIAVLEQRLAELKDLAEQNKVAQPLRRQRRENPDRALTPWNLFVQRVHKALREGAAAPLGRGDALKFCKHLKEVHGVEITAEQILAARVGWESLTPVHSVTGDAASTAEEVVVVNDAAEVATKPEAAAAAAPPVAARRTSLTTQTSARTPLRRPSAPLHPFSAVLEEEEMT